MINEGNVRALLNNPNKLGYMSTWRMIIDTTLFCLIACILIAILLFQISYILIWIRVAFMLSFIVILYFFARPQDRLKKAIKNLRNGIKETQIFDVSCIPVIILQKIENEIIKRGNSYTEYFVFIVEDINGSRQKIKQDKSTDKAYIQVNDIGIAYIKSSSSILIDFYLFN